MGTSQNSSVDETVVTISARMNSAACEVDKTLSFQDRLSIALNNTTPDILKKVRNYHSKTEPVCFLQKLVYSLEAGCGVTE